MLIRFEPYPERILLPEEVPLIITKENISLPGAIQSSFFIDKKHIEAIEKAFISHKIIVIVPPLDTYKEEFFTESDLNQIGSAVKILQLVHLPEGGLKILTECQFRVRITKLYELHPYPIAKVEEVIEFYEKNIVVEALMQSVLSMLKICNSLGKNFPVDATNIAERLQDAGKLSDFIGMILGLDLPQLIEILNTIDPAERLKKFSFLSTEVDLLQVKGKLQAEATKLIGKTQRDYLLRQQLKIIQKELGEEESLTQEIDELTKSIKEANMPKKVEEIAFKELSRLSKMNPASAEFTVTRTYLDYLISMPWSKSTEDKLDINNAKAILDEDHYNLEKVKERILEFLAVRKLKGGDQKGPILCFVGPPGVGKTSLGKSIARSLGRKFIRLSLGGMKDEAEIRGHRRTYVGAMPGRIIQEIKRCGSNNPVFILDEVDKIGRDFRGDPSSALLEVLDPEQNNAFLDHYLDVPFDLSKVLFITTANLLDPIPAPLRDRMEVINISGYTEEEKVKIAEKHLIPKQIKENGLEKFNITFTQQAIIKIIREYTREAGLRNLERNIANICRKIAKEITQYGEKKFIINERAVSKFLGPRKFYYERAFYNQIPGVAIGLAWTESGGDIIFVEATKMKGDKGLILTGYLGDVMKESAQAAVSYIRSNAEKYNIDPDIFSKHDIHIHVPQGAIPKDGPSAGITIVAALLSLFSNKPVRNDVAMTGEITLTGRILPIGGIKEKALAARRSGIKKVIIPKDNEADLQELPKFIKKDVTFITVNNIEEAIPHIF